MALDKATLKAGLKSAMLANIPSPSPQQTTEIDTFAGAFADAIDIFVKSGTVTVTVPIAIPVQVNTGTGTGATTATAEATGDIE